MQRRRRPTDRQAQIRGEFLYLSKKQVVVASLSLSASPLQEEWMTRSSWERMRRQASKECECFNATQLDVINQLVLTAKCDSRNLELRGRRNLWKCWHRAMVLNVVRWDFFVGAYTQAWNAHLKTIKDRRLRVTRVVIGLSRKKWREKRVQSSTRCY